MYRPSSNSHWTTKAAKLVLLVMGIMALLADFIANDKPLIGQNVDGQWVSMITEEGWNDGMNMKWGIFPPIRYSSSTLDFENTNYARPLSPGTNGARHWLGTDLIGRDVAAGMVHGCRYSLLTALVAVLIALLIGLPMGIMAGYFGNNTIKVSNTQVFIISILSIALIYQLIYFKTIVVSIHIGILFFYAMGIWMAARSSSTKGRLIHLPLDTVIMRILELLASLPGLLILLALSAMIEHKGIGVTAFIIGLIGWARIAQLARNESLRIKANDFIASAQALGLSRGRIITHHLLPNIWPPILVSVVFSVGAFILLESTLSFLGIGTAIDQQTWGSLLAEARRNFGAWWLAIFPGAAIFLSIVSVNVLGKSQGQASA
jgi:peptide/nickel transport system permease protein